MDYALVRPFCERAYNQAEGYELAEQCRRRGLSYGFALQLRVSFGTPCPGARPSQALPEMRLPSLLAQCER
eukprot:5712946-Alexandrium_andersonii.AAC.1